MSTQIQELADQLNSVKEVELGSIQESLLVKVYAQQHKAYNEAVKEKAYDDPDSVYYGKINPDLEITDPLQPHFLHDGLASTPYVSSEEKISRVTSFRTMYNSMDDVESGFVIEADATTGKYQLRAVEEGEASMTWGELDLAAAQGSGIAVDDISTCITSDNVQDIEGFDSRRLNMLGIQMACGEISEDVRDDVQLLAEHGTDEEKKAAKQILNFMDQGGQGHWFIPVVNYSPSGNDKTSEIWQTVQDGIAAHKEAGDPEFANADIDKLADIETESDVVPEDAGSKFLGELQDFILGLVSKIPFLGDAIKALTQTQDPESLGNQLREAKDLENISDPEREFYTELYHKLSIEQYHGESNLYDTTFDTTTATDPTVQANMKAAVADTLKGMNAKDAMFVMENGSDVLSQLGNENGVNPLSVSMTELNGESSATIKGGLTQNTYGFDDAASYTEQETAMMSDLIKNRNQYINALNHYSNEGTNIHDYLDNWTKSLQLSSDEKTNKEAQSELLKNMESSFAERLDVDTEELKNIQYGSLSLENWMSSFYLADDAFEKTEKTLQEKHMTLNLADKDEIAASILPKQAFEDKQQGLYTDMIEAVTDRMEQVYGKDFAGIATVQEAQDSLTVDMLATVLSDSNDQSQTILKSMEEVGIDKDTVVTELSEEQLTRLHDLLLTEDKPELNLVKEDYQGDLPFTAIHKEAEQEKFAQAQAKSLQSLSNGAVPADVSMRSMQAASQSVSSMVKTGSSALQSESKEQKNQQNEKEQKKDKGKER